ncbi:indole-3-glycerol phosphate synthase [Salinigranum rubrum]|uniref:Indole-3-glycerol phosphate synthase n=1 Tax=Salinigranum rubrum TaxID=755307 RepID=A0A2I8VGL5_9EURY|nr:indole-3-glycerol phosphate synthase [Salinigranum rubrum]AUV81050.1 indole-3-glycerol phosphate synthase [Salinigranum rubrum]
MNDTEEEMAPAVRSILAAARGRSGGDTRLSVDARSFPEAVAAAEAEGRVPVVAEVKPTSPTTDGRVESDPVDLAREMVSGGATALSVLTEPEHFGGSPDALRRVREAVDVPVLRKDFVLHEAQLDLVEADLVLLIARFLGEDLSTMVDAARARGFQPLVEVHSRAELRDALDAGAEIIGVNNRDLARLEVDLSTFERVAPDAPDDVTLLAESGVTTPDEARRMRRAGADALLIGSAIMDGDVRANTERFVRSERTRTDETNTETTQ